MNDDCCYLVSILYEGTLIKCAVKLPKGPYSAEPMSALSRQEIWSRLPLHVRSCGPVVDVEELFEVVVVAVATVEVKT